MDKIVYKDFVKAVSQSASEVAQQIVADRVRERMEMISASVSNVEDVVLKDEGKGDADSGNVEKGKYESYKISGPGLGPSDLELFKRETPMVFRPQGLSHGGRKTRRIKRTRKPKKSMHKKTRKRRI